MKKGCTIFIGNIDFDIPESKIVKELSIVGKVVSFKLIYDKNTGKSKGYGFCEYENSLIAQTALKTLNFSFNGRPVKINPADHDGGSNGDNSANAQQPLKRESFEEDNEEIDISLIETILENYDKNNLMRVIEYFKQLAGERPDEFLGIFNKHRKLNLVMIEILLNFNIITEREVEDILRNSELPPIDQLSSKSKLSQIIKRLK